MTRWYADNVKVTTSSSGLASFSLGAAEVGGFRTFADADCPDGAEIDYIAFTSTHRETGVGIYDADTNTLSRDTIFSPDTGKVNFTASPTVAIGPIANRRRGLLGISIDEGAEIATGVKGELYIPYDATITAWTILADQPGEIQIDVWVAPFADYPPTVANSITNGVPPALAGSPSLIKAQGTPDDASPSWNKFIPAGSTMRFNVDSVSIIRRCSLVIEVDRGE